MFKKYLTADNSYAQLDGNVNTTQVQVLLKNGQNVPTAGNWIGTLVQYGGDGYPSKFEKVYVSAIAGNLVTVTRAYDGSTAQTFNDGDYIFLNVTSEVIKDLQNEVARIATDAQFKSEKNQANGYAGLDSNGKLDPAQIPALKSHEFLTVTNAAARYALTTSQVQVGDEVLETSTGETYVLIAADPSQAGSWLFKSDTTPTWNTIAGKPTTIAGYGITDAYTKTEIDNTIANYYTKTQTDAKYVTLATDQNITGYKTFTADVSVKSIFRVYNPNNPNNTNHTAIWNDGSNNRIDVAWQDLIISSVSTLYLKAQTEVLHRLFLKRFDWLKQAEMWFSYFTGDWSIFWIWANSGSIWLFPDEKLYLWGVVSSIPASSRVAVAGDLFLSTGTPWPIKGWNLSWHSDKIKLYIATWDWKNYSDKLVIWIDEFRIHGDNFVWGWTGWVPTVGGDSNNNHTYSYQFSRYHKKGKDLKMETTIQINSKWTTGGFVYINSPYTLLWYDSLSSKVNGDWFSSTGVKKWRVVRYNSIIMLQKEGAYSRGWSQATWSDIADGDTIQLNDTFELA